jgi:hypothetical protein
MSSKVDAAVERFEAGLETIRQAPADAGTVELIVRRPAVEAREVVDECELDLAAGLVGDNWLTRGSRAMADGSANPKAQLTVMSSRLAELVVGERKQWSLAGDQLYVDFDLAKENVPPGTRLAVGSAIIEVTDEPHTGCAKFSARFGSDALRFINSPVGRELNLRGVNARVIEPGRVRRGDAVRKL